MLTHESVDSLNRCSKNRRRLSEATCRSPLARAFSKLKITNKLQVDDSIISTHTLRTVLDLQMVDCHAASLSSNRLSACFHSQYSHTLRIDQRPPWLPHRQTPNEGGKAQSRFSTSLMIAPIRSSLYCDLSEGITDRISDKCVAPGVAFCAFIAYNVLPSATNTRYIASASSFSWRST